LRAGCDRESGCREVEGMWVMKYSWKQRRWRAGVPIDEGMRYAEGSLVAFAQMQATGGRFGALGRWRVGFHMSSRTAKDAWREYIG
jgi:hypothetical protein